jgi:branched-chain amino acid transport system substrate-binding protein
MFRKKIFLFLALLLAAVVALAGCGGGGAKTGDKKGADDKSPIKIGVIGAFQLTAGKEIQDAAKLAIDEINKAGGIMGRQIEPVYADTKANPEEGKSVIERLLFQDKVQFVVGEHRSEVALAVQPIMMENKKIFICTGAASPVYSDNVVKKYDVNKYSFRTFMNSNQMADQFIKQLKDMIEEYKFDKVAVVAESAMWVEPIIKSVKEQFGNKIVLVERPATDAKDFSVELSKVQNSGAKLIFTLFSADQGLIFCRQWADRHIPALVTGYTVQGQSPNFWDQTEGRAQGYITWKHGVRSPISDKTIPHWDKFKQTYGRVPGPYTEISTYDAFYVLKEAIEKAGSLDSDKLVKVLEENTFVGTSGKIKFGKGHDPEVGDEFVPFTYIQWQNKEMTTVWPQKFATGKVVKPDWMK